MKAKRLQVEASLEVEPFQQTSVPFTEEQKATGRSCSTEADLRSFVPSHITPVNVQLGSVLTPLRPAATEGPLSRNRVGHPSHQKSELVLLFLLQLTCQLFSLFFPL